MARIQDRTSTFPIQPANSFQTTLPCRPNGVCTNKEGTQCAVGGRNLLKVFAIEEKNFVEKTNLIVGPKKLNHAITDVQWHSMEDNYIASSAGNGVVILWDLNKVGNESKQDHIFQHHYRFVSKICFHPSEPSLLMSGSKDGNMHLLDIRQKKLVEMYRGKADGIEDIQFHPMDKNVFCAACESGNVQLWDIRKPEHHYNQFTAHRGPVFTLNWHPEDRFKLSTGGRDTSIKIWDTQLKTHPINIIQTIAPVACIKWRPNYKNHIASCALILDNSVTIWDIRRPYVPFATFEEHTDVTTGIVWQKDPDVIISCSKDKLLYNHAIVNAKRPAENANPVALGLAPDGVIGHALTDSIERYLTLKSTNPNIKSPPISISQPLEFKPEKSNLVLYNFHNTNEYPEEALIKLLAKEYKFYGKPFAALCDHNASVASKYGLSEKALTWTILKLLYIFEDNGNVNESMPSPISLHSMTSFMSEKTNRKLQTPDMLNRGTSAVGSEANVSSSSDEEDIGIHTPSSLLQGANQVKDDITMVGPEFAVFYDDDYNNQLFSTDLETEENEYDDLPDEAIQLRQRFSEKLVQHNENQTSDHEENVDQQHYHRRSHQIPGLTIPDWEFESSVKDMLYHYAEKGDIQMTVTVMLVLQKRLRDMISKDEQEEWYNGYLDMLYQFQLFNVATEVINYAPDPINIMNQNSTTVHMQCQNCNKTILAGDKPGCYKPGCYCSNCQKIAQTCAICRVPVRGLFVWCQGCGHGGHLLHVREWYNLNTHCPTGCGHKCEYS